MPDIKEIPVRIGDSDSVLRCLFNGSYVPYREEYPSQLGRRYLCGHPFQVNINGRNEIVYKSGNIESLDGSIYLGCGTEVLCIKASTENKAPYCCNIPMSLQQPKVLPSAD